MGESQGSGVQRLPVESREFFLRAQAQQGCLGLEAAAVETVAKQRVTEMRQMDTDLMRPSGLKAAADEACDRRTVAPRECFAKLPMRHRFPALRRYGHFFAIGLVARERRLDRAPRIARHAPDESEI